MSDTALRFGTLRDDLAFVRALLAGLPPLLASLLVCGLQVVLLLRLLPAPRDRPLRLALGLSFAGAVAARASRVFDPERCLSGAVAAGTLVAFHAPLRVAAFLAAPPSKPSWRRVLALVAVPASAILPDDPAAPGPARRAAPAIPVPPVPALWAAVGAFAVASFSAYVAPRSFVRSSLYLLPLITTLTYGFVNFSSAIAALLGQFPISTPFCWPWFAPSLGSFWAHRWNAPIASALRAGVYDPLVDHVNAPRAVATIACFVVSGAGHVALLYYVRQVPGMPLWFMFFCLHGVGVCLERLVLDSKLVKNRLHWRMCSTSFMLATAELLFVPAFRDSRFFDDAVYELATAFRIIENISVLSFRALIQPETGM
jgi:hypothetical protein